MLRQSILVNSENFVQSVNEWRTVSVLYLIGDNQILELIWENQFRQGNLSDQGQSDIGIDLGKSIQVR